MAEQQSSNLMSVEDIVGQDYQNNFADKNVSLQEVRQIIYSLAKTPGVEIARIANTLFIIIPKQKRNAEVHLVTADRPELYLPVILRFVLALHEKRGIDTISTPTNAALYKKLIKLFGRKYVQKSSENGEGVMVINLKGLYNISKGAAQ